MVVKMLYLLSIGPSVANKWTIFNKNLYQLLVLSLLECSPFSFLDVLQKLRIIVHFFGSRLSQGKYDDLYKDPRFNVLLCTCLMQVCGSIF